MTDIKKILAIEPVKDLLDYNLVKKHIDSTFNSINEYETPYISKITIKGTPSFVRRDADYMKALAEIIMLISRQRPKPIFAKKNIAQFKLIKGGLVGFKVDINNKKKIHEFLQYLVQVVLPRSKIIKPWRARNVAPASWTMGLKSVEGFMEVTPEISLQGIGISISFSCSKKNRKPVSKMETIQLLHMYNIPLTL